jgi:peptidoglycan/LPS O-acetylase OafA/YrhL
MKPVLGSAVHSENLGKVVFVVVCLGINLGLAWLSFRWIEAPIMTWKKRFDYEKKAPLTGAGPASTVLSPQ